MEETENFKVEYRGLTIAKNTVYNLLGHIVPLLFALAIIPVLLKGLGTERFGILSIAWMIIGYFSFFDFGISRGVTKIIAEKIGLNQTDVIPRIFWTSLALMIFISLLSAIILSFFIPALVSIFNISESLQKETESIILIIILSIPLVTTMAGLRGLLEAYQKFKVINILRIFLGIFSFLGPLLVLMISNSLYWIIVVLILLRIIIWIFYLLECIKINESLLANIKIDFNSLKPVIKFSIWVTIGNIIVPVILYSDRFIIGIIISAAALTFYVTPYEIVTKLLLVSIALSGVLFPVFSGSYLSNPDVAKKIFLSGVKLIFVTIYPIVLLIITFAYEGIDLWLGKEFAVKSSLILQLLAIGILMNSLSLIPNNFFQGAGRPRIPTLLNLLEFPVYLFLMWYLVKTNGIQGAAFAFMFMASVDALLMYVLARKIFSIKFTSKINLFVYILSTLVLIVPILLNDIIVKLIFFSVLLIAFSWITWNRLLSIDERNFIISKLKLTA